MRTKLFRAFLFIILIALLSNFIFQWLIVKDFDRYVESVNEDHFRWVCAEVESAYINGKWNQHGLSDTLHWAMMLGIEARIVDAQGQTISDSEKAIESLPETMRHEMAELFYLERKEGPYKEHPLIVGDRKIGSLFFR